jgi:hypothetical protein
MVTACTNLSHFPSFCTDFAKRLHVSSLKQVLSRGRAVRSMPEKVQISTEHRLLGIYMSN